jgi:hypothetical protein
MGMNPTALLPDIGYLQQVRIQAGGCNCLAESRLVHPWRTGCDDDPVQLIVGYGLADGGLARLTARVFIVAGSDHHRHFSGSLNDPGDVHGAAYISTAVTDKYADSGQFSS